MFTYRSHDCGLPVKHCREQKVKVRKQRKTQTCLTGTNLLPGGPLKKERLVSGKPMPTDTVGIGFPDTLQKLS